MKKGWALKRLGDLSEVITKGTTPTSIGHKFVPEGINFVKVESIGSNGKFIREKFAHITNAGNIALKRSQLKKNDILFSIAGALGRTAIVDDSILPANTNQALAIIRLRKNPEVLIEYVLLSFSSGFIFDQIENLKGGVAQQNLSLTQISNFQIPIPSLPEQKRIVAILDEAFAAIDKAKANAEKNLANAKELFDSYLNNIFSNPGEDWKEKKLGDVCNVIGGGTPSKKNKKFYTGGIYWATVRDMKVDLIKKTEFKITKEAVLKSSTNIIPKDNVIIATRVGLGKACLIENDTAINQDLKGIIPKNSEQLSVDFLFRWFKSISNKIIQEGTGATVQGIKLTFINSLTICIPPIGRQKQIVDKLDDLKIKTKKMEIIYQNKFDDLDELKKSILKKAFEGEL